MECVKIDKNYKDVFKNLHFHSKSRVDVYERKKKCSQKYLSDIIHMDMWCFIFYGLI